VDENTCLPIGSEAPTQTSNDLPRALTEFGQQAEVSPSRWPVPGVAINQSAIALLRLLGRRLLELDGENLVGLRRINFQHFNIPVQVAEENRSCGLGNRTLDEQSVQIWVDGRFQFNEDIERETLQLDSSLPTRAVRSIARFRAVLMRRRQISVGKSQSCSFCYGVRHAAPATATPFASA